MILFLYPALVAELDTKITKQCGQNIVTEIEANGTAHLSLSL
jgi:hypothetical protein